MHPSYSTQTPLASSQDSAAVSRIKKGWRGSFYALIKDHAVDILLVTAIVVCESSLKFYLAWQDPVLRAVDPWQWTAIVQSYSASPLQHIFSSTPVLSSAPYYPKAFPALASLISAILGTSAYDTIRFFPVISALNLIPMYFLSLCVSKSRRVAVSSVVLVSISKFYSIRTSIANAECFTHFWLAFSLLFLLRLDKKPTWPDAIASAFFITMTTMFWHLPIAIFAVFLTLLAAVHLRNSRYLRKLTAVLVSSSLSAGLLWYFWAQPLAFIRDIGLPNVIQETTQTGMNYSVGYYYYLSVMSWGWVMLVLGLCGLVCTLSLRKSRHDPSKAFLVVYFASIAFLVLVCLVLGYGYGFFFLSYLFSALALPVSIFGAMALIGVVDAVVRATSMKHLHTSEFMACRMSSAPARRRVRVLSLVALVVVVIASSNVANYGGESAVAYPFDAAFRIDATIPLSDGNLRINYVMVFRYAKSIDAPSNDVYNALRWIRDYSSEESHVVAFLDIPPDRQNLANVIRRAFPDISAREFTDGTRFASSLMRSPTEFRQEASNASGGDTYIVIGVYSWLQEKWANSTLEGRFLEYAAQGPDLFPQVYFSHDVHVFRINANPNIDSFRMPCVRTTAIWNHATTRSGSKRPSADQSAGPGNLCTRPGDEPLNDREAETSAFKPPRS